MNWDAQRKVWDHAKAKGSSLLVLAAIADFADADDGRAWPSMPKLAKKVRLSERETRKVISKLERSGELRVIHSTGGRNRRNAYYITIPINPVAENPVRHDRVKGETLSPRTLNPVTHDRRNPVAHDRGTKVSIKSKQRSKHDTAPADRRPLQSIYVEKLKKEAEEYETQQAKQKTMH